LTDAAVLVQVDAFLFRANLRSWLDFPGDYVRLRACLARPRRHAERQPPPV